MKNIIHKYYKEPLYRNSIFLMLNSASSGLFGLLFWIVVARSMSSEKMGLATAAISASGLIIALSRLGLDQGLVRYLPELKEKSSFYSAVLTSTLVLAISIAGIFLIGIKVFSPLLTFLREGWFLPIFILYIVITSINYTQNVMFIAIRRADLSLIQNLFLGLRIPLIIYFAPFGVYGIFSAYEIAFLFTLIFGIFSLHRQRISFTRSFDTLSMRKALKFSLGNYSAGIFTMLPTTVLPIMIVSTIGAEEGAYFYVAYSIASLLFVIPTAVSTSLLVEGSHNSPLKENVLKSTRLILKLLIPAIVLIFAIGDKILLLFSQEYSEQSIQMLQLISASCFFSSVTSIFISIKNIQKDVSIINYVNFTLAILIIGIGYIALLKDGLLGLGYAWLGSNVVVCLVVLRIIVFKEKWI